MKPSKTVMAFRVTKPVEQALRKAALKERRPVAHWIELALEAVLVERGLIPPPVSDG